MAKKVSKKNRKLERLEYRLTQENIYFTDKAKGFALETIDMAKNLIADGGSLGPFMVVDKNREGKIIVFESEILEGGVAQAKEAANKIKEHVDIYSIAYDAKLTVNGEKTDAIVVEVGEDGKLYIFAQRYHFTDSNRIEFIDKPKYMAGQAEFR